MRAQDRQAFGEVIAGFAELKGKQLSAPALELYWRAMRHWRLEDFRAAAEHLLRHCEFMPTPRDFERLRTAGRLTAGEAWAWVLSRYPAHRGEVREPTGAERAVIERAVRALGGWQTLDRCEVDKIGILERRFCEHFAAMRDADEVRAEVPQVAYAEGPLRLEAPKGR